MSTPICCWCCEEPNAAVDDDSVGERVCWECAHFLMHANYLLSAHANSDHVGPDYEAA